MDSNDFYKWCELKIQEYPSLKDEILGIIELFQSEVESGESVWNEIDHGVENVEQLIDDYNANK